MKFDVNLFYIQEFLQTEKCRKVRKCRRWTKVPIEVAEPDAEDFPVAFIDHSLKTVFEGAQKWQDFLRLSGVSYEQKMVDEEVRVYGGRFFKAVHVSNEFDSSCISSCLVPLSYIPKKIASLCSHSDPYFKNEEKNFFEDEAVLLGSDLDSRTKKCKECASRYVIFDREVWEECEKSASSDRNKERKTGIKITYSWGDEEFLIECDRDSAWSKMISLAAKEVETSTAENEGWIDVVYKPDELEIVLHYQLDDEYCYYRFVEH